MLLVGAAIIPALIQLQGSMLASQHPDADRRPPPYETVNKTAPPPPPPVASTVQPRAVAVRPVCCADLPFCGLLRHRMPAERASKLRLRE